MGGFSAIKALFDSIRKEAHAAQIDTLTLDAGDFSDGTLFRYADHGLSPYHLMDLMGYEAITIGNHDWLLGCKQFDELLGKAQMKTPLLGANFNFSTSRIHMSKQIVPYLSVIRGGARIAILGLTSNEVIYSWRIEDGAVIDPEKVAKTLIPKLRNHHDFIIVLSHLGLRKDIKLIQNVPGINLVIGGHSHTLMPQALYIDDPEKRLVPIVQAGDRGNWVGSLLVDLEAGSRLKILHYQLIPTEKIKYQDPEIEKYIRHARMQLENQYGKNWLYEVIAQSEVPMQRPIAGPTVWGTLSLEAIREAAGTQVSLDINRFYGSDQPAGPITRENLYNFFPRTFNIESPYGWTIWKIRTPGWALKLFLNQAAQYGEYIMTSGISYQKKVKNGKITLTRFRIGDKPLHSSQFYTIAVSEGVGRGAGEMYQTLRMLFLPKDTKIPVWNAIEDKLKRMGNYVPAPPELH